MAARPARAAGPKFLQQGLAVLGSEMKLSFIVVARVPGFLGLEYGSGWIYDSFDLSRS